MKTHKINDKISLHFCPVKENFFPKLVQKENTINIPLLISDEEIDLITERLDLIDFLNLPFHYIKMVVSGCISTVIKYP